MEIKVFKNNNKTLYFEFYVGEGVDYDIPIGTVLKFSIKKSVTDSDDEILFSKSIIGDGSSDYTVELTTSDTNLPTGVYYWDLKNITDGVTITHPDKFIIEEVVLINE